MQRILLPLLIASLAGCASVTPSADEADLPLLPRSRLSSDSVILEIGFVDVPADDLEWSRTVWCELDEQYLPPPVRRRLLTNGFRCGLVGVQLPCALRQAIDERQADGLRGVLADMAQATQVTSPNRRIQARSGKRSEIVTASVEESMVVLLDDGENVVGTTFHEAQPVFTLKAFPQGDGSARLELTPEIQFGPPKQKWTGRGNGVFQLEAGRDSQIFSRLKMETTLSPGHTLVVSATGPNRSLGGNFFGASDGKTGKMLLIRLAQTQYDDLFAPDEVDAKSMSLTTELD